MYLLTNLEVCSLSSSEQVPDAMPSSAAIGFLKIDVEHKGTLETEGSSQYFSLINVLIPAGNH